MVQAQEQPERQLEEQVEEVRLKRVCSFRSPSLMVRVIPSLLVQVVRDQPECREPMVGLRASLEQHNNSTLEEVSAVGPAVQVGPAGVDVAALEERLGLQQTVWEMWGPLKQSPILVVVVAAAVEMQLEQMVVSVRRLEDIQEGQEVLLQRLPGVVAELQRLMVLEVQEEQEGQPDLLAEHRHTAQAAVVGVGLLQEPKRVVVAARPVMYLFNGCRK